MSDRQVMTIPSFARVEIKIRSIRDILAAADELRSLAAALDKIGRSLQSDESSVILAHHAIRATSKKLRGT